MAIPESVAASRQPPLSTTGDEASVSSTPRFLPNQSVAFSDRSPVDGFVFALSNLLTPGGRGGSTVTQAKSSQAVAIKSSSNEASDSVATRPISRARSKTAPPAGANNHLKIIVPLLVLVILGAGYQFLGSSPHSSSAVVAQTPEEEQASVDRMLAAASDKKTGKGGL